jgi:hypothetical protein
MILNYFYNFKADKIKICVSLKKVNISYKFQLKTDLKNMPE